MHFDVCVSLCICFISIVSFNIYMPLGKEGRNEGKKESSVLVRQFLFLYCQNRILSETFSCAQELVIAFKDEGKDMAFHVLKRAIYQRRCGGTHLLSQHLVGQGQRIVSFQGQPGMHSEFQVSLSFIARPHFKK
jgi:hypothetical protein